MQRQFRREKINSFHKRCWNDWRAICEKKPNLNNKTLDLCLASYIKINLKWIIDIKAKLKA